MNEIKYDPRKQFSKKLAKWTAVFWFFFMTWLTVLFLLVPDAALYCVYMAMISTAVMLLNVWAYTRNSIYEKGVLAMLNKAKLSLNIGGKVKDESKDEPDEEPDETEGVSNG